MEQQIIIPDAEQNAPDFKKRILSFCHAVLILIAAYTFVYALYGVFEHCGYPPVFLIGTAALFMLTLVFCLLSGGNLGPHAIAALLFGLIAGLYPFLNGGISLFGYVYLHVLVLSYTYFVLSLFENHSRTFAGGILLLDIVKATFVYPFASFTALFTSLFQRSRGSKKLGRSILFVFLGIVVALVLGGIAVALLSYDPKFKELVTIDWDWDDLPEILVRLILTVPIAALLFGAFVSSRERKVPNLNTPDNAEKIGTRMQRIPVVVLVIPAFALLVIYGLFFFTQWDAYMGAFSGHLPASFTAAEYARSGFFELCTVAAINAILGIVMTLFMKQTARISAILRKTVNTLMAIATLILIATALSKMLLYIRRFDLTVARLLASTILILIAIGYVASLLSQWIRQIKVIPVMVICVSVLLLIVPFVNVRGHIAKYNVDQYLARAEQNVPDNKIDIWYLCDEVAVDSLGSAGVPDAVRLWQSGVLPSDKASQLKKHLRTQYDYLLRRTASERSISDIRAINALQAIFGSQQ